MPKRSIRKSRKRRGRRPGWFNHFAYGVSALSLAKTAVREIWKLKGLINSEKKKFDRTEGAKTPDNTGIVDNLVGIAQGDGDQDRNGNSIYVRSVNIKGNIKINAAASNTFIRVSVVQDTQQIADTVPAWTDIYESADVNAHLNNLTVGRFKVLKDRTFRLDADDPGKMFEINLPMRHHVRYNGSATSDIQKGAIYLCMVSNEPANTPTLSYQSRVSYHDN